MAGPLKKPVLVTSSAPLPIGDIGRQEPREVRAPEGESASSGSSGVLPRSRRVPSERKTSASRAVKAVLLGAQGAGMLMGVPMIAQAQGVTSTSQPATEADIEALRAAGHALEVRAPSLSARELREARRALWDSYVAAGVHTLDAPAATEGPGPVPATDGYEQRWAQALPGSIDRGEVEKALAELGTAATPQKLSAIFDQFSSQMDATGRAAIASAIAAAEIKSAAADGTLSTSELAAISGKLEGKLGAGEAGRALLSGLPESIGALDDAAASWILERYAGVETHAARLQSIIDEMLPGTQKLFDGNGDQKLDGKDFAITKAEDGKVTAALLDAKTIDKAKVAQAMIEASYKMSGSGISFALIKNHKANPELWTVGAGGVLTPKPGVKPSEAVADMLKNGNLYGFECATGLVVVYYQAMLDLIGPKDFDRIAADLRIGPWVTEDDLDRLMVTRYPQEGWSDKELGDHRLTPGHYYYFKNWDVTDEARARGWQGENVIYLGEGKFYGHGIGLGDAEMFISKLRAEAKPDGKTPSLANIEAYLATDALKLDKTPD
ncbi:MAG: hypothetical protein IT384_09860 [Deltaproteobacteria bacterium]|nr:hypothetical protein [Deltaproteobacteria bacterium]